MAEANSNTEAITRGKVTAVCRQFLASADEHLAHRLQNEEYDLKYEWNRGNAKVARVDVPLAKSEHDKEEERLQKERYAFLQQQQKLAEEDEQMAKKLQQEEQQRKKETAHLTERDAEVALELQKEEERRNQHAANRIETDDARIALEMQKQEILGRQRDRAKVEIEDEALARMFQEQERKLSDMRSMEREVREQRRLLELELLQDGHPGGQRDTVAILGGSSGGYRLSNIEFMSDAERREVQKLQDEELARALQEHEEKKARRAHREITAEIEQRDAELARIMQEVERLELAKRQHNEQRSRYIIVPVPQVESASSSNLSSSARSRVGSTTTNTDYAHIMMSSSSNSSSGLAVDPASQRGQPTYAAVNRNRIQQNSESSNDSVQPSPTSVSPPVQNAALPPTESPPPPPPPPPMPMQSSGQGANYSSVTHSRVTETRSTTQSGVTSNSVRQNETRGASGVTGNSIRQNETRGASGAMGNSVRKNETPAITQGSVKSNNTRAGVGSTSPPAHYQAPVSPSAASNQARRQSSKDKDKNCKQQ